MKNLITTGTRGVNPQFLQQLLSGEATAYTIQGYLPKSTCNLITRNFLAHPDMRQDPVNPPINKVGHSLYEVANHEHYFLNAAHTQQQIEKTFIGTANPMKIFLAALAQQNIGTIQPAQLNQQNAPFGILREWCGSTDTNLAACIHEDFVLTKYTYRNTFKEIGRLDDQFSIVICISDGSGGTTRIYNKRPTVEDYSRNEFRHSYGFTEKFVQDIEYIDITLKTGDLLMFRSSLLHSISKVTGTRITQQCFLGMVGPAPCRKFRYWS